MDPAVGKNQEEQTAFFEELDEVIAANGGKLLSGVSKKLNYFIVGENAGPSKIQKATQLNVPMISEADFRAMLVWSIRFSKERRRPPAEQAVPAGGAGGFKW